MVKLYVGIFFLMMTFITSGCNDAGSKSINYTSINNEIQTITVPIVKESDLE